MRTRIVIFLILCLLSCVLNGSAMALNNTKKLSARHLARIQSYLAKINKPAVKSIKSPDGDIIDCVPWDMQPAFDHPLLQAHKNKSVAPVMPKFRDEGALENYTDIDIVRGAWQAWHHAGSCPRGTVPIRRTTVDDVLRAKSLSDFGKKPNYGKHRKMRMSAQRALEPQDEYKGVRYEYAIASTSQEAHGAKAVINVWDPSVLEGNEFSLAQMWVFGGAYDVSDLNSVEAGWQVNGMVNGDRLPRLFTFWTADGYGQTGCFNLLCSGFIQTSEDVAVGAAIANISSVGGTQFVMTFLIWKDPANGDWWLRLGNETVVGYWPANLFTHLADRATMVEWGGEVTNSRINDKHTTTDMGSGHFAEEEFGHASFFRNLEIIDLDNNQKSVESVEMIADNTYCYSIKRSTAPGWGTSFYYGGPGQNPSCP